MKHENFSKQYREIKQREIEAINKALLTIPKDEDSGFPSGEYHFSDCPYITCCVNSFSNEPYFSAVKAVKYPITEKSGILVTPQDDNETYEIGYSDVSYGDLDFILDYIPDF